MLGDYRKADLIEQLKEVPANLTVLVVIADKCYPIQTTREQVQSEGDRYILIHTNKTENIKLNSFLHS